MWFCGAEFRWCLQVRAPESSIHCQSAVAWDCGHIESKLYGMISHLHSSSWFDGITIFDGPSLTLTPEMKLRQLSWGSGSAITTNSWSKSEELFFGFTAQQAATHFRWYVWDSLLSRCVTCCGFWPKVRSNSFEYDEDILRWEWEWFCLHWALAFGLSLYDVSRHSAAAVGILRTFRAAFTEPAYADIYPSQRYQLLF